MYYVKPFGEERYTNGTSPTSYTFTGQDSYVASFGLMFYQSRWYDPALGRWNQPDSIISDIYSSHDFDRYSYVRNNPLRYVDPDGKTPWDVVDIVFFLLSVYDFGSNPTWANAGWLLLDTLSLAPVIPSVGSYLRRGAQAAGLYDEVAQFAAKYGDDIYDFAKIAHKRGATTLLRKFLSGSAKTVKGARFELEYAIKYLDDIVEIGRNLPSGEIDFVLKGDVFVNVKNYDWSDPFFQKKFGKLTGLDLSIAEMVGQAQRYAQYASQVEYVFKGSVPDKVRKALEAIGIIVEVIP